MDVAHRCLPSSAASDSLLTKIEQLKKKEVNKPFVFVQLADFLPHWCVLGGKYLGSDDEESEVTTKPRATKRYRLLSSCINCYTNYDCCLELLRLSMLQWMVAFDRYAIASAAAGQWSYADAMAHKDVVLEACSCVLGINTYAHALCILLSGM